LSAGTPTPGSAYADAGVDVGLAGQAVRGLVEVLDSIDPGRPRLSLVDSGQYAAVLKLTDELGLALSTDSVGSKVIVAEQTGRFDTIGIDCIAMNVNDLVCVGARPLALLDYIAVERADPAILREIAFGLKAGAEEAGIEIPGGEVCQVPELLRGHPSPTGFDLVGSCVGTVALDAIVTGADCAAGDVLIGLPSTGLHSNGYTLARRALLADGGLRLDDTPPELGGSTVGETLIEPTAIYVRGVLALLDSDVPVHGLAHITGDGVLNLLRLAAPVGYRIEEPLRPPPVFELLARLGGVEAPEMWEVFNMGCGFVAVVPEDRAQDAVALLGERHPGVARIGTVTDEAGRVALPGLGLDGDRRGLRASP
jgi:phosphoribosylformylglycinamidine cyclo-ligase